MKCGKLNFSDYGPCGSFRWGLSLDLAPALLAALLILGMTPALPQDSEPKSSGSSDTSQTFELSSETLSRLRNQASNQLTELMRSLSQASRELQASKTQSTLSQSLLDNALQKLADLENTNQRITDFNRQIGERMLERDIDLANAYAELDAKDKQILKMRTAIAALGLVCLGLITFGVIKLLLKLRIL
jgi:TolA-binding protein